MEDCDLKIISNFKSKRKSFFFRPEINPKKSYILAVADNENIYIRLFAQFSSKKLQKSNTNSRKIGKNKKQEG